jgi:anti-anti-sigma factor
VSAVAATGPLVLDGELTVQSAAEHKTLLLAALEATDALDLDLSGVSELDTAGLQLLLLLKREAGTFGKTVTLSEPSQAVLEVLALARLDLHLAPATSNGGAQ